MYELAIVGAAPTPCVTTAEAKQHLRVDIADDDLLIGALVDAAQGHVEQVLAWRALTPRTYSVSYDTWNGYNVYLPMPPISAITSVSIVDDEGGTSVVLDPLKVKLDKELGRLRMTGSTVNGGGAAGRLVVVYSAGYTVVPGWARAAVLLLTGHLYENREGVVVGAGVSAIEVPLGVVDLAAAHKAWRPGGAL
jgi:uncharacterized phiE125 gp8 family phage protein